MILVCVRVFQERKQQTQRFAYFKGNKNIDSRVSGLGMCNSQTRPLRTQDNCRHAEQICFETNLSLQQAGPASQTRDETSQHPEDNPHFMSCHTSTEGNNEATPAKETCGRDGIENSKGGQEQEEARAGFEGNCDIKKSNGNKKINIFIQLSK